ncbi:hypothetical protein FPOAC1_006797 [Fusarium poae]|uniref:hypothetical protein n=1 Tax=Fusarium poae TaxID=36050 RepID=UPI001CEA19BC|nr:hypothetical protein FPOAC1_006797 [Fusarium poae]KAG8673484.1 hypothetical protein FPOAC1_006797 [Fusarium poae]
MTYGIQSVRPSKQQKRPPLKEQQLSRYQLDFSLGFAVPNTALANRNGVVAQPNTKSDASVSVLGSPEIHDQAEVSDITASFH